MKRTVFRLLPAWRCSQQAWPALRRAVRSGQPGSRARRTASGRCTPPTSEAASIRRSIRSTPSNFSKLEVAWRFKTDNLGPRPENKLEGTPHHGQGHGLCDRRHAPRRSSRSTRKTGEMKWIYSMDEGERAARWAPRQLSGRGVSYWTDGKGDDRIVFVTTGYRLVELNAKTGQPIAVVRQQRRRRPEGRRRHRQGQADRPREGRNRPALDADRRQRHGHRRLVDVRRASATRYSTNAKGLVARVRREDRQADLALQHDSEARASSATTPGRTDSWEWTGNIGVWTQITRRSGSRPRLPAGRNADHRRIRRQPSRQQPVCRSARRGRPEDRRAQVALPAGAPRPCGITTCRRRRC